LREAGYLKEKDGALWFGDPQEVEEEDRVVIRSNGQPTYFASDLGYLLSRFEQRGFHRVIEVWGADHHGYVPRMTAAMSALGHPPGAFHAIVHQLVHLFRGKEAVKMSKRAGEFVTLRELAEMAGVDACRFFFAMRSPNAHMNFDVELARKKTNENPVFYVQYVHARIASIFREAAARGLSGGTPDWSLLTDPAEKALLVKAAWLPAALAACEKELSPHPLPTYLMELAGLYHPFYEKCRVLDPDDRARTAARLALCGGVKTVIAEALGLLGVSAPEEM
ncbi:MAG: arginine--tRNA ligase, partial [Elusimicrobia bacterium]|nr:arginine--tRNA ligase [Elusimicrobiota bacterium]